MFIENISLWLPILIVVALWSIAWKGWALWLAARNKHVWWFIILLVVNTVAILEIIYIFSVGRDAEKRNNSSVVH